MKKTLYAHQQEALNRVKENNRGIVCMPTGTGKSLVEAHTIIDDMRTNHGFNIYVVTAPRIILSLQLFREMAENITVNMMDARFINLHSGKSDDNRDLEVLRTVHDIQHSDIISTTSIHLINEEIEKAKDLNQPVVIFSTYHSACVLGNLNYSVRILINDEAHYLVQERFNDCLDQINAERTYFFTATKINSRDINGLGMNNSSIYGEDIYTMIPREAVDLGLIVRPRLHVVSSRDGEMYTDNDIDGQIGTVINECYDQHQFVLGVRTNAKMLVATSGSKDIYRFMHSREYADLVEAGIKIYCIASDDLIKNTVNGKKVQDRKEFLKMMQEDGRNPSVRMIVVHYDILSEGIDVPGLTGVVILRNMVKHKFIQTVGRILRLNENDRKSLNEGSLKSSEVRKYKKPYGYVILPWLKQEDTEVFATLTFYLNELRSYGFDPSSDLIVTNPGAAIPVKEGPEALMDIVSNDGPVTHVIDDMIATIEDEKTAAEMSEVTIEDFFG